jgi:Peptidase M60, enhancin and enhancin-like/N-terminal domain of M60-like peptidases
MRLLCVPLLAASAVFAAVSPEEITPTKKAPFVPPAEAARGEINDSIKAYMAKEPGTFGAHAAAQDFPGSVEAKERVARTVAYDSNLVHRWDTNAGNAPNLATGPDAWQETGLYAAPGEVVIVKVASIPENRVVKIIVGCHRDSLLKLEKWNRFPVINRTFDLKVGENKIANAFGGQLFIQSSHKDWRKPVKAAPSTPLQFSNAVAMPTYVLGKDTPDTWMKAKQLPAPWVTLVGKQVILHVQASEVKQLTDPKGLLEWWDKAMSLEDDLIGLTRLAPERVVPDRQISAGFMHSGYPFMCWIDPSQKDSIDLPKLTKEGNWGFFHELGHNHQSKSWTFDGQTEVTCNLFSLYVMEKLVGKPQGRGHPAMEKLDEMLAKRFAAEPNKGPFEQLATFVVLIRAHGWGPLRETLRSYASGATPKGATKEQLQSLFTERYGKAAKADVSEYFEKMGYHVESTAKASLKGLPAFKPTLPTPAK